MPVALKIIAASIVITSGIAHADQIATDDVNDVVHVAECRQVRASEPRNPRGAVLLYSNSLDPADPYKKTRVGNQCSINGDAADVQLGLGLTLFGVGCQAVVDNALADDFVLTQSAVIEELVFYLYQTGATEPTIDRLDYAILSTSPLGQGQPAWTTVLNPPVTFTNVFRKSTSESDVGGCTRRFQRVSVTLTPVVALPAGQYWLAWRAAGTGASGPWQSPVVIPGLTGKPGANGLQSPGGGVFAPYTDATHLQDFIFELYGALGPAGACCDLAARNCTDFVALPDCQGPFKRYHPNQTCATLDPPCDRLGIVSYQGNLTDNGAPVDGTANFRFSLFDAATGGAPVAAASTIADVFVQDGLFTAYPAFDRAAFSGQLRWLQIEVEFPAGTGYVALGERQPISLAPMALYADYAAFADGLIDDLPWSQLTGLPAGFADGTDDIGVTSWAELTGIPAGFADGIDDIGVGDITAVNAGLGLTGGGLSGSVTLAVNFAGNGAATTVARSDHYHSALAASDGAPSDAATVDAVGNIGIGETTPLAKLHISNGDAGVTGAALENDELIVEAEDATIGLYSTQSGSWSSAIALKELLGGVLIDTWGIARRASDATNPSSLHFTYGPSNNYATNPAFMVLTNTGDVGIGATTPTAKLHVGGVAGTDGIRYPDGTLQTTAAPAIIKLAVAVDPPSLSSLAGANVTVTVTGAAVGDAVVANPGGNLGTGYILTSARVSAADTVTLGFYNASGAAVNPSSTTWQFRVIK